VRPWQQRQAWGGWRVPGIDLDIGFLRGDDDTLSLEQPCFFDILQFFLQVVFDFSVHDGLIYIISTVYFITRTANIKFKLLPVRYIQSK